MFKKRRLVSIPIFVGFLTSFNLLNPNPAISGAGIGVDVYCVMREGGNSHEASWRAAYESIKTQKRGLFKTSPRQAAAMIVEAVVREPEKFKDCISYLGDLYPKPIEKEQNNEISENQAIRNEGNMKEVEGSKDYSEERYSY